MPPLNVLLQIVGSGGCKLTLVTVVPNTLVFESNVNSQVRLGCCLIFTLRTRVSNFVVLGFNVKSEVPLGGGFVITFITMEEKSFMYDLDI